MVRFMRDLWVRGLDVQGITWRAYGFAITEALDRKHLQCSFTWAKFVSFAGHLQAAVKLGPKDFPTWVVLLMSFVLRAVELGSTIPRSQLLNPKVPVPKADSPRSKPEPVALSLREKTPVEEGY